MPANRTRPVGSAIARRRPHQQAIRVVDVAPQMLDNLWLVFRAEGPLSASAARAAKRLREQDWLIGTHAGVP